MDMRDILSLRQQHEAERIKRQSETVINRSTLHADLSPEAGASHTMAFIRNHGKEGTDISERVGDILKQTEAIKAGDLSQLEGMLYSQALTTQSLFNHLSALASVLMTGPNESVDSAVALLHVALKAQNQSRQTIQALAEIKNPKKAVFIKRQQNLLQFEQAKLQKELDGSNYASMDIGSSTETSGTDQTVEALGIEQRADKPRRKKQIKSKQL